MAGKAQKARDKAREYFGLKPGDGLVLHHVDPTLRHTNRKRYNEWRIEDLVVMTKEQHLSLHHKGKKLSEEHKKRIREANRDKKHTDEAKRKISESMIGQKRSPFSEEHRKRIGEAQKGKKLSEENKQKLIDANKRPVEQYALNGELVKIWESATQAEKEGFNHGNICKVCKGKRPHHKGYIWRYVVNK